MANFITEPTDNYDEECIGCARYASDLFCAFLDGSADGLMLDANINDCPCRMCLVKMMCLRSCKDRYEFWKDASSKERIRKMESLFRCDRKGAI